MKLELFRIAVSMLVISALPVGAIAKDISGTVVRAGLSQSKPAEQRATWWKRNMASQCHRVTGRVKANPGQNSRILIDIGSNVTVTCLIRANEVERARKLRPGTRLYCRGIVGSTWEQGHRLSFNVDATVGKSKH